ncbi:MAG TPA: Ni/Fe hydrogenase subunit gamma [Gammaproteobacteria bacterium]|nr:Ni/Fe hydrogenase subunit gamma [Gammaproteobacteria bacterium]
MSLALHHPVAAEIIARQQESPSIVSLTLRLEDRALADRFQFQPGQFNMLYLHGAGEIPVSISSDPSSPDPLVHTIRDVGRVSHGLAQLRPRDRVGLRGPFGRGWPVENARHRDVIVITGGLGCAPLVPVIDYVIQRRSAYGRLIIMQGVKHSDDLIWRERYAAWDAHPDTRVLLAADVGGKHWNGTVGPVTELFDQAQLRTGDSMAFLCGPEPMIRACVQRLLEEGLPADRIWISMERNMQCALGHCGHCQFGARFVCRDGPVFCYADIRHLFGRRGF